MINGSTELPETENLEPAAKESFPFWSYGDLAIMAGLVLPSLFAAIVVVRLFGVFTPSNFAPPVASVLAVQFVAYGFWFSCLYVLLRLRYEKPFWDSMACDRPGFSSLRFLIYGPLLSIALVFLGAALRTPDIAMPMKDLLNDRVSLILVGIFAVTLGSLCEELAFRGFLLPLLSKSIGAILGITVTALVFSALHGPQYAWSWRHLMMITLAGVAFGWVRWRSNSTTAATIMHAGYNLTLFAAYLTQWEDLPTTW